MHYSSYTQAEMNRKNRLSGKWHYDFKKRIIKKKCFKNVGCGCVLECFSKVTGSERKYLFEEFHKLTTNAKKQFYIRGLAEKSAVETSRFATGKSKKDTNYKLILKFSRKSVHVCGKFLSTTFVLPLSTIYRWCRKELAFEIDHKSIGKPSNNSCARKNEFAITFLNNLPFYDRHYCRRKSSGKKYLDVGLTVIKLYRMYKHECESKGEAHVSQRKFYDILDIYIV